ncbi:unnamed protein product [Amoebophrya sp. A120]|nr:unnamed protein product [Amoebophrya sp. A120]|eukprot:GSA120T00009514001.1
MPSPARNRSRSPRRELVGRGILDELNQLAQQDVDLAVQPGSSSSSATSQNNSFSPSEFLECLNGAWRSNENGSLVHITNGRTVKFSWDAATNEPSILELCSTTKLAALNTIFSVKLDGGTWTANGVRKDSQAITWHSKDPTHPKTPIIWQRTTVPARDAIMAEQVEQTISAAEEKAKQMFESLRRDMQSSLASDVVPTCKICLANPIGVALLGCGHVLCTQCAEEQCRPGKPCFVCKIPYHGRQLLFFS